MADQSQMKSKRTFYDVLQLSTDADADAIAASYQRLKEKYENVGNLSSRSELLFIEHAFEILSEPNRRTLYDKRLEYEQRLADIVSSQISHSAHYHQSEDSWFTSSKLIAVMLVALVIVAYGLFARHSEENGKISLFKDAIVANHEVSQIGAESNRVLSSGAVENTSKSIDLSAEIALRNLDIQRQDAETRRMEAESRIQANEDARKRQIESQKAWEEKQARCQYLRSLINQANHAGAYEEARALQARGC